MKNYLIAATLVLFAFIGLVSFRSASKNTPVIPATQKCGVVPKPANPAYKAGDVAKDFHLRNVDGKMISLADFTSAKGYIVVFTCNHCPVAKLYESRLLELDKQFAPQGYPVIAINPTDPAAYPDDSYDEMVSYANERHYTFPYLDDASQEVTRSYGATNTPHVFVLNKENGNYVVRYTGAIDDNAQDASAAKTHYVADAVNALLAGKSVATPKTKAIGCGIKMKHS